MIDIFNNDDMCELTNKDFVLFFSGGSDSVLNLLLCAEECKKDKNRSIYLLYTDSDTIHPRKRNIEKQAIEDIVDKISYEFDVRIYLNYIGSTSTLKSFNKGSIKTDKDCIHFGRLDELSDISMLLPQTTFFIGTLLTIMPQMYPCDTNIVFGFNMSDNHSYMMASLIKPFIENIHNLNTIVSEEESKLKVVFPLLNYLKTDIFKIMATKYPKYFKLFVTCENPKDEQPCGKCNTCKQKYAALTQVLLGLKNKDQEDFITETFQMENKILELLDEK